MNYKNPPTSDGGFFVAENFLDFGTVAVDDFASRAFFDSVKDFFRREDILYSCAKKIYRL